MRYAMRIYSEKSSNVKEISIGNGEETEELKITSINIQFDSLDNNVKERSNQIVPKLTIVGSISYTSTNKEDFKNLLELFNWAKNTKSEETYRSVEIKIKDDDTSNGIEFRTYNFSEMFVVDYAESLSLDDEKQYAKFSLTLNQKAAMLNNITSFLNS